MTEINTHNLTINFGKHKGQPWTRLPISYLKWIMNEPSMGQPIKDIAAAELKRRGTTLESTLEISGHAIDRASLHCRKIWHETARDENEGIHAWLTRVAEEALEKGQLVDDNTFLHMGMKFGFAYGEIYPTLKTVMRQKPRKK